MHETNIERFLIGGVVFTFVAALAWYAVNNQMIATDNTPQTVSSVTVTALVDEEQNDAVITPELEATATLVLISDEQVVPEPEPTATFVIPATVTPTPEVILAIPTDLPAVDDTTNDIDTGTGDVQYEEESAAEEPTAEEPSNETESTPSQPQPTPIPVATAVPTATARPVDVIRGEVRWSGEKRILYDVVVDADATLIIEPNTTVFMAPGTSFYITGSLRALGSVDAPVRITGEKRAWGGIYVRRGGDVVLEGVLLNRGGATATLMMAEEASVVIRDTQINNNLGHIQLRDSSFSLENSTMRDNRLPYGAAINATYTYNNAFRINKSRVGPNTQAQGAPAVAVNVQGAMSELAFEVNDSLLTNKSGPNLQFESESTIAGSIQCNTFVAGDAGVSLRSNAQMPIASVLVRNNAFEQHRTERTNQYEPHPANPWRTLYGMTSNVGVNAHGNWWDHATGPYDPIRYSAGLGELAGVNVDAASWLTERPVCAPKP